MLLTRPLAALLAVAAVAGGLALLRAPAQTGPTPAAVPRQSTAQHKVAIHVDQNDKAIMELALNNAKNISEHYRARGESVAIEIVAYGPGLHMLRKDTSPVKDRIAVLPLENPGIQFTACGNTQANQAKAENKPVVLLDEANVTPSGVVRLMELQHEGYAYLRP